MKIRRRWGFNNEQNIQELSPDISSVQTPLSRICNRGVKISEKEKVLISSLALRTKVLYVQSRHLKLELTLKLSSTHSIGYVSSYRPLLTFYFNIVSRSRWLLKCLFCRLDWVVDRWRSKH